jgi:hypothetical protein
MRIYRVDRFDTRSLIELKLLFDSDILKNCSIKIQFTFKEKPILLRIINY